MGCCLYMYKRYEICGVLVRRRKGMRGREWPVEGPMAYTHIPSRLTAMLGGGFNVLIDQVDLDLSS